MTDIIGVNRRLDEIENLLERLRKADSPNGRSPPYTQRALISFPLASSGTSHGEFPQFGTGISILVFRAAAFVVTTNTDSVFWTITLRDDASTILATIDTSAMSPNTWT